MSSRLPDFLCVGTQKGGTTTLQKLLEKHPETFLPSDKELQFFSLHYERGKDWYCQQFEGAGDNQRCGEITPYYIFHPEAPSRIHKLIPNVQIIVLLRDPVERALSHYFHARRHGFEPLELEQALKSERERLASGSSFSHQKHSYVSRSLYIEQLSRLEDIFAPEQLLILRSEDLFDSTLSCWQRIQSFIGLSEIPLLNPLEKANAGSGEANTVSCIVREWLRSELRDTVAEMKRRYGISWNWS